MRSDKISENYRPPNVPKYILPNTYITCIFEKLFFLFKGTGCYKNRLIQFPFTGLIFEKLISQDFRKSNRTYTCIYLYRCRSFWIDVWYLNEFEENNIQNTSYAIIFDEPYRYIELLIVCKSIFEKLFFLFKGTGCYKNRLIQFPYTGLIFEKLISQDFRPD
jgi:hypothetical protein